MNNTIILKTERLILRPLNLEDAKAIFDYRSDVLTNKYQGCTPKTIKDSEDFLRKISAEINIDNTWFQFALCDQSNLDVLGDFGIHFLDDNQAEIGFTLAKEHHGKGLATEAAIAVIDFLFNQLNKHRIIASLDPRNIASIKLLERLGFRKEAHFKESLFINNEWLDDVIYAILKREWKPAQ